MKFYIPFALLILFFGISCFQKDSETLNPDEFEQLLNTSANSVLVDVRTVEEFNAGHIENSINADYKSSDFINIINKWDKSKTYFVYCKSGVRSSNAVKKMHEIDFHNIHNLKGGIIAWEKAGKIITNKN